MRENCADFIFDIMRKVGMRAAALNQLDILYELDTIFAYYAYNGTPQMKHDLEAASLMLNDMFVEAGFPDMRVLAKKLTEESKDNTDTQLALMFEMLDKMKLDKDYED